MTSPFTVGSDWLAERLDEPDVRIVDGSWHMPATERVGAEEYDRAHVPGAVFFDIDAVADPDTDLPHMLASPEAFTREAGRLGVRHDHTIVVYDASGLFSAPRVWWNFRTMGATKCVVLEGGLDGWIADRLPIEAGRAPIYPDLFAARFDADRVVGFNEMRAIVADGTAQVVDARPAARFAGQTPEPRPGIRSGHMPGALNVPFDTVQREGRLLPSAELRAVFERAGVALDRPVVTSCGSGVTAAILSLALETIGHPDHRLYDGSWSEWGARADVPVATA